jgi:TonB family protein
VIQPTVEQTPHPKLGAAAATAVSRWRFEPGKRQGRPVPFKMRVPITFMNT